MNAKESAIKRIKMLKQQFEPTKDFHREMDNCSFNLDLATEVIRGLRPEEAYKTIEIMDSIVGDNFRKEEQKAELRTHTNKMSIQLLQKLFESGTFDTQKVIDDLDLVNRCTMNIGFYSSAVTTKYAVQLGLYAKSIKNLGTKIHEEALRKAATFKEMG